MDKILKKAEDIDLSGADILRIIQNKGRVITYHELQDYQNLEELLENNGACVILYETKENLGHFCSLFYVPFHINTVEFFDPYGSKPDAELNYATYNLTHGKADLTRLLDETHLKIIYNKKRLQTWKKDVNTCGRWAGLRVRMKTTPLSKFQDLFLDNQFYRGDLWATALTYLL
tara:strand:- start:2111 stop:2632 length:522 start_codon:yes stop_codon:yes gene_type:complete